MPIDLTIVLKQVDDLIDFYQRNDLGNYKNPKGIDKYMQFATMTLAAINRIAGSASVYAEHAKRVLPNVNLDEAGTARLLFGTVNALRTDLVNDYLIELHELIHADLFSDYLEMAEYLLRETYKDAAAVIIGSTLEEHLRKLCQKHNIPLEDQTPNGPKPRKAETMNVELTRHSVISKLVQKSITAWLDLRNKAAHGKYIEYSHEEVSLFLQGVRHFILSHPA